MSDLLKNTNNDYGDDAIVTLSPREHIRLRPGMYIGKLGDGSQADDGIYVLIKEVVDNSVDEFIMGAGKQIEITVADNVVTVRDYGRGIPLKSLAAAVSEMNTGGKYGGTAFKKTVGLNGVGVKAVNMLSSEFTARSVRDGEARTVTFAKGLEQSDRWESGVAEKNGTASAALILGILSIVLCVTLLLSVPLGIIAIVLGVKGRRFASEGRATNGGSAVGGIITGSIGAALGVFSWFILFLAIVTS